MKIHIALYFLVAILLYSCTSETADSKKSDTQFVPVYEENTRGNDSTFTYTLPESDYKFEITITGLKTEIVENAFTKKADQYSLPEHVDGYYLTVKFSMTNPYDNEMLAPVPDYYYITSYSKEYFSSSTIFHRDCQCDIDNSSRIKTDDGKELFKISEGRCGHEDFCVRFKPQETKHFLIQFTDPIYGEVDKVLFWGFDRKSGQKDMGLLLNVKTKHVEGDWPFL